MAQPSGQLRVRRVVQTVAVLVTWSVGVLVAKSTTREQVVTTFNDLADWLWITITAVAVLTVIIMLSHLVPKKEY